MKKPAKKTATKKTAKKPAAQAPARAKSFRELADESLCALITDYGRARLVARQVPGDAYPPVHDFLTIANGIDVLAEERAAGRAERAAAYQRGREQGLATGASMARLSELVKQRRAADAEAPAAPAKKGAA